MVNKMLMGINILMLVKYTVAILLFLCVLLAPAYLAVVNDRDKLDRMRIRCGSLLFGWSFIGWFYALFISSKK